ncbi:MAG: type II toxin-antitoxin system RelE/ParE family toxin [Candidatus Anammoxibacter sp.]
MIKSFKHKGLKRFYDTGSVSGIQPSQKKRLRLLLIALDTSTCIGDMDIPGFNLHPLKGKRKGLYAISVSANWRITFIFEDGNAYIVNYEDYH